MKRNYFIIFLSLWILCSCTQEKEDLYVGQPKDLRYAGVADYKCGDFYTTYQPSVFTGGGEAEFKITNVVNASGEAVEVTKNFSIDPYNGVISFLEYNDLLPGDYTFDIAVANAITEVNFQNVLSFEAHQVEPSGLYYLPNLYSTYGNNMEFSTALPNVKGGGPYTYKLNNHTDVFMIDATTGSIHLAKEYTIGDDEFKEFKLDVAVENAQGEQVQESIMDIEVLGANIGQLLFHGIAIQADSEDYGLQNLKSTNYFGTVTKTLLGEEYTTVLNDSVNNSKFVGETWRRAWSGQTFPYQQENGVITDRVFAGYWSDGEESRSFLTSETIDLSDFTQDAYIETSGLWRYSGGAEHANQHISVAVVDATELDEEFPADAEWEILENDISDRFIQFPSDGIIKEIDLKLNGSLEVQIPEKYLGKQIQVALIADFLNPEIGALTRRFYVHELQVRAK
ncbi:hypothetical protein [Flammeovirga aprica]|uniref:Uncharacterized protein n=1 Tax=Flammeovirga aprica JL-4 TaxID=694437 RepID=A0A7X9XCN2_9BACT|nr:hypothetical protein [Flammeovirga aprica]NME72011.1 hypothetical protein [Flammeovirga aprica JL-4]